MARGFSRSLSLVQGSTAASNSTADLSWPYLDKCAQILTSFSRSDKIVKEGMASDACLAGELCDSHRSVIANDSEFNVEHHLIVTAYLYLVALVAGIGMITALSTLFPEHVGKPKFAKLLSALLIVVKNISMEPSTLDNLAQSNVFAVLIPVLARKGSKYDKVCMRIHLLLPARPKSTHRACVVSAAPSSADVVPMWLLRRIAGHGGPGAAVHVLPL